MMDPKKLPGFDIRTREFRVKTRKLKATWTLESCWDLEDLFSETEIRRTPLEELVDLLDDPRFDPEDPRAIDKARRRYRESRRRERSVRKFDRRYQNIARVLLSDELLSTTQSNTITSLIITALDLARSGDFDHKLHDKIMIELRSTQPMPSF